MYSPSQSPKRKRDHMATPALDTSIPDLLTPEPYSGSDSPRTNNIAGKLGDMHFKDYSSSHGVQDSISNGSIDVEDDLQAARKKPRVQSQSEDDFFADYSEPNSSQTEFLPSSQSSIDLDEAQDQVTADGEAHSSELSHQEVSQTIHHPPKRKKSPPPSSNSSTDQYTWHDHEITGREINGPDDDGEGINGIGFKPTPSMAAWRKQRRKQQVVDWRTREAKEARQRRLDRREKGSMEGRSGEMQSRGVDVCARSRRRTVRFA